MNAGVAIFTLLASQLIGYGMAGMLTDLTVKPSYSIFPAKISLANTFQALHFDGGLGTKRTKFFWGVFAFMFVYESESPVTRRPSRYRLIDFILPDSPSPMDLPLDVGRLDHLLDQPHQPRPSKRLRRWFQQRGYGSAQLEFRLELHRFRLLVPAFGDAVEQVSPQGGPPD
jgi:hypothetical protein